MSDMNVTKIENEADSSAVEINRKASDGDIIDLQKDGTTVGSVGVDGGDNLYLTGESGNTGGIYMNDAAVSPAYQGVERDDYYNLGKAPARWKDLYLSGGVYLGGTGGANKLQDYEYGSWTPVLSSDGGNLTATYNGTFEAEYVKGGTLVFCTFAIYASSISGGSGNFRLGGLPFTSSNAGVHRSGGPVLYNDGIISKTGYTFTFNIGQNSQSALIRVQTGTNANTIDGTVTVADIQSGGGNLQGSFTFIST
jgi:hypothetical protein